MLHLVAQIPKGIIQHDDEELFEKIDAV